MAKSYAAASSRFEYVLHVLLLMVAVFAGSSSSRAQTASVWKAQDIALDAGGKTRVMWRNANGLIVLWRMNSAGQVENAVAHGTVGSGWSGEAMAVGPDGKTRVVWANTNGQGALWTATAEGAFESVSINGPHHDGFGGFWKPIDIAVGADNKMRVLWRRSDGRASLWLVNSGYGLEAGVDHGPFTNAVPLSLSVGGDGKTRLMWNTQGSFHLWLLSPTGVYESQTAHGPYPGWMPLDLAVGSDNKTRMIWERTGTSGISLWSMGSNGLYEANYDHGPYAQTPDARTKNISHNGTEGRLLWRQDNGTMSFWYLNSLGNYGSHGGEFNFVPLNLAAAGETAQIRLNWTANGLAKGHDRYKVYRSTSASGPFALLAETVLPGTSYVDTTATPGTAYWYRVATYTGLIESAQSAAVSATAQTSISVNDASIAEGNSGTTNLVFTLTLSRASSQSVSVKVSTNNSSATAPADYEAKALTTVTFAPGTTTQNVVVPVVSDTVSEVNETFALNLSEATNATLARMTATGTIVNDDTPSVSIVPTVQMPERGYINEYGQVSGVARFVVSLSGPSDRTVIVNYVVAGITATANHDYPTQDIPVGITFGPGTTSATISIRIYDDSMDEEDETFRVTLSNPQNATLGNLQSVCTIVDDDDTTTSLSISNNVFVTEGNTGTTNLVFTLNLSQITGRDVRVNYATANGTASEPGDYTRTAGTVTIAKGQASGTITIPIVGDTVAELNETFTLNFSNVVGAYLQNTSATATITNDDTGTPPPLPTLSIADASVTETNAAQNLALTVTLSAPSTQPVSFTYATQPGTAGAPNDYSTSTATLTIPAGQTSKTFTVTIAGDTVQENLEAFTVLLSNPSGATIADNSATVSIADDDAPPSPLLTVSVAPATATEGDPPAQTDLNFTVTLSRAVTSTVTVNYATSTGSASAADFSAKNGTLTFSPNGPLSQTVTVKVTGDDLVEPTETMTLTLSIPAGATLGTDRATGTILDDDSGGTLSAPTNLVATGGYKKIVLTWDAVPGMTSYEVQRSQTSGTGFGVISTVTAPATSYIDNDASLVIGTTYYYVVKAVKGAEKSGVSNQASAAPQPPFVSNLSVSPTAVLGNASVTGTVTLSDPALAGGATVVLKSSSTSVTVPQSVQVAANGRTATFGIAASTVAQTTSVTITASYGGFTQAATLTLISSNQSFNVLNLLADAGNACVILSWGELPEGAARGYNVYRRIPGGAAAKLTTSPRSGGMYVDSGLSNGTTYEYQVTSVNYSGVEGSSSPWLGVTPSASVPTLTWVNPPSTASGALQLLATASSGPLPTAGTLLIDGKVVASANPVDASLASSTVSKLVSEVDTSELSDGAHTFQIVAYVSATRCATLPLIIQISNGRGFICDEILQLGNGGFVNMQVVAPQGRSWHVKVVRKSDGRLLREWAGSLPSARWIWDGTDSSGTLINADSSLKATYTLLPFSGTTGEVGSLKLRHPSRANGVKSSFGAIDPPHDKIITPFVDTHSPNILILIDKWSSQKYDQELADYIQARIVERYPTGDQFYPVVLATSKRIPDPLRVKIKEWMANSVTTFYLYSHGFPKTQDLPAGAQFGQLQFWSEDLSIIRRMADSAPLLHVNVSRLLRTSESNIGRQYNFAFMDNCGSAGGVQRDPNDPELFDPSATVNWAWRDAFNIGTDQNFSSALLAWNGSMGGNVVTDTQTGVQTPSQWLQWRQLFWAKFVQGYSVSQSVYQANTRTTLPMVRISPWGEWRLKQAEDTWLAY